jgi:hypothetical protein
MIRALYTAASGMVAQELNLDNVANNLANSSTAGFRRRRLQFEDLIYQNLVMPGAAASQQTTMLGLQVGLGTRSCSIGSDPNPGQLYANREPSRFDDSGPGLFLSASAQRPDRLHPGRQLPSRRSRHARDSRWRRCPAHRQHTSGCDLNDSRARWHDQRDPGGTNRGAAGGISAAGAVQQSRGAQQPRWLHKSLHIRQNGFIWVEHDLVRPGRCR